MADNGTNEVAVKQEKAPIAMGSRGIQITTHQELWAFASHVCKTSFVPKEFHDDPGSTMVAMEYALELGLPMLQGLQNIMVVNGRPSIWGDLGLAMVEASGLLEDFFEDFEGNPFDDDYKAICIAKRRGRSRPTIWQYSVMDAKVAKLWMKKGYNQTDTPWVTSPKRMLQMRARWFVLRNGFADVLRGLYGREEMEDSILLQQTAEGYSIAPETALPAEIQTQLKGPPARATANEIKELIVLMLNSGVPKDNTSLELRKLFPQLAEGRLTQKYLQETLTLEEYQTAFDLYTEKLKTHVESDVLLGNAPLGETKQENKQPRLATIEQTDELSALARERGASDDLDKMFAHTDPDKVTLSQYEVAKEFLLKRPVLGQGEPPTEQDPPLDELDV